jgi:uncharacterized protein
MADQIRYDLLTQQALRGVVRTVLADAAKKGLPGEHHFFITFATRADGVRMSDRLRAQYPDEMTVILQHQFWDLTVSDTGFEVGLSFGGITERLGIPFDAINAFVDPSVQFGLQFEEVTEGQDKQAPANAQDKPNKKKRFPNTPAPLPVERPVAPPPAPIMPAALTPVLTAVPDPEPKPDKPSGGGEVVRLDRFRKK